MKLFYLITASLLISSLQAMEPNKQLVSAGWLPAKPTSDHLYQKGIEQAAAFRPKRKAFEAALVKIITKNNNGPRVTKLTKIEKTIKEPQVTKTSNGVEIKFDLPEK